MAQTYDFHTLSPLDFEELVRDLLQAHWGVQLESFGPGRDTGIDLRYLDGPNKTIIQAKHYLGSGYSALLRGVKAERDKARRLASTRYLIATSVSLTPARKEEIVAAMPGVPLITSDVIGAEDLNNLIGRYPAIERQHFKLWLGSTNVLERILHSGVYNRTAAEIDIIRDMVPRFVQNRSVGEAERKLTETGALIIAGPPGVGKTTLARILLWLHAEQEWNIFVVDSIEEAFKVADPNEKRLILLDDFLGQVRLSADHVRGIDSRLPPLISRMSAHKNLRFILTTRDYILAQARQISARLAPGQMNAREYVLNVGQYTRAVKARILYNHLYFSALSPAQRDAVLDDDFYLRIIDHPNFNPRIVQAVTSPDYLALTDRPAKDTIEAVLANPEILWELPYRQHIEAEGRMLLLALFLNGRGTGVEALKASFVRVALALGRDLHAGEIEATFRATYRSLDGSALGLNFGMVVFVNPGLRDFLQSVVIADLLVPVLLPVTETPREISELWAVFLASTPAGPARMKFAHGWAAAIDRMAASGLCGLYQYIELASDICSEIEHPSLRGRLGQALDEFENNSFAADDVGTACSLIERSFAATLPFELDRRFRTLMTRAAAELLSEHADELNFEDAQSLDEALHSYGNNPVLARRASHDALESLVRNIDQEIRQFNSVEELDDYESTLFSFMKKRSFPTDRAARDIQYRRDTLFEEGRVENRGSYSSGYSKVGDAEISNDDIASMFRGLGRS